jgi:hypothetical protein
MINPLPVEEMAVEVSDAAAESFRNRIRLLLTTMVTLGEVLVEKDVTQTQRRSLLSWCAFFARGSSWVGVRSMMVWARREGTVLQVAHRVELYGQVGRSDLARGMTPTRYSRLCEMYGTGSTHAKDGSDVRPCGVRAVLIADDILADLLPTATKETVK